MKLGGQGMVIGLLQCDDVAPERRRTHGNYPQMFEALFHRVDPSLTLRVWRCLDGEIPDDVEAVDAWLTTGSKFGVNDDLPWIADLEAFVRTLWVAGKPLVGICFGHQLMARALGGSDFCPAYLMQVGEHFLGVQGHPEFTRANSRDLMARRADLVGHHRVREGEASLSAPVDDTLMVCWILAFMRRAIRLRENAPQDPP
ncbi:MAG: type 1 glutamine amidotransferase [Pseudomonadota bacterium]